MTDIAYYIICAALVAVILVGISLMSRVAYARAGNLMSAAATDAAIIVTLFRYELIGSVGVWVSIAAGSVLGIIGAYKIKMIEMPQAVALLNGFGGLASAFVALIAMTDAVHTGMFTQYTAAIALAVGAVTFSGSLIAAGKLHKLLPGKPMKFGGQTAVTNLTLLIAAGLIVAAPLVDGRIPVWLCLAFSLVFGALFSLRVGGADMPITISLLNSLSGVAGGIAGITVNDPLLCATGGIVGASGLILTQIMCRAMNRSLASILLGTHAPAPAAAPAAAAHASVEAKPEVHVPAEPEIPDNEILKRAKNVIIIPGYGMALAQAQQQVKDLCDKLEARGASVRFAIHPVAGRMPGHMNVLLCEAGVPYESLFELEAINGDFKNCDAVLIVGANDVVNPSANTAVGTPIYGMPILNAGEAKHIIVCNYDTKPGYAGVENSLYKQSNVRLLLGNATDSLKTLSDELSP